MSIIMPILYLVILGNSFQGKLHNLPLIIVNHDEGEYARKFIANLRAVEAGPRTLSLITGGDDRNAIRGVDAGTYKAALIIPREFSRNIIARSLPGLGLFVDNTDGISSETIRAVVAGALQAVSVQYKTIRDTPGTPVFDSTQLYTKVDYSQSLVPGVVIMAIFLGALTTGAFNLVMDRFLGVEESYMLTPLTKADIVLGLIISGLAVTTVIALVILLASTLITGLPFTRVFSNPLPLLAIIVLTTLSLQSLMFVLLGRIHHPRIVGILSGFMNVILFFPSGAMYPVASFPGWLKTFSFINPEAYAVRALKSVIFKGSSMAVIGNDLLFLAGFTVVMMSLAIVTFKRTL
jgi:ABC-2 type transport system permease protein